MQHEFNKKVIYFFLLFIAAFSVLRCSQALSDSLTQSISDGSSYHTSHLN